VTGKSTSIWHRSLRVACAVLMTLTVVLPQTITPAVAANERALYLYYTHTKETARIVFKRNGQYDRAGLQTLNVFLRDWRRNEPANMDPRLFDLVWEVYQEVGGSQPINVVSAYRSPKTNAMLRESSSGVAENSQHMRGTAMDFFIPGVSLSKLRAVAMRKQVGGVGYYPTSGSPFVHLDVGSVRAWPRMTRAQLKDLFPDGRTMHLPTDGKPLSQEGYQVALAEWKQCHMYPCNGSRNTGTQVADGGGGRTLMDMFFGNKQPAGATALAAAPKQVPQPTPVTTPAPVQVAAYAPQPGPVAAPLPAVRSNMGAIAPVAVAAIAPEQVAIPFSTVGSAPLSPEELASAPGVIAPVPMTKSRALQLATAGSVSGQDAVTAIAAVAPMPMPRLNMTDAPSEGMTAYAAGGETAIELTPAALPDIPKPVRRQIAPTLAAVPGQTTELDALFRGTFNSTSQSEPVAVALADHIGRLQSKNGMRSPDLVAPDLEHVADVFTAPVGLTTLHFANVWDQDEADFDPTPEMGRYVQVMKVGDFATGLSHTGFVPSAPVAKSVN
jgi:uncharacterized protein YcbK (DUF882 family)